MNCSPRPPEARTPAIADPSPELKPERPPMSTALKTLRNHLPSRKFEREIAPGVRVHIKRRLIPFLPSAYNLWDGVRGRMSDAIHSLRSKPEPKYRLR
jgi:hypothetical protein